MGRENRLRGQGAFQSLRRRGRRWSNHLLVLLALPRGDGGNRYGFAVSRRVGKAVTRNRVKRWLREGVRNFPLEGGWDMLFIVRPPAAGGDFHIVREAMADLLRRGHFIREDQ